MNKTLFALFALSASLAVAPASGQMMCGPGQQAQASSQQGGGMMCGMGQQSADDPMADKSEQKPQQQSGMCACCKNMAMMGRGGMQHHNMPGMDMPKQQ